MIVARILSVLAAIFLVTAFAVASIWSPDMLLVNLLGSVDGDIVPALQGFDHRQPAALGLDGSCLAAPGSPGLAHADGGGAYPVRRRDQPVRPQRQPGGAASLA